MPATPSLLKRLPPLGFLAALLVLIVVLLLPQAAGLPLAGQRLLAILAFAVVLWLTEAVSYEVSAVLIVALIALLVGTAPNIAAPDHALGTSKALSMAMSGFTSSGLVLVAAALFIAAAMTITGLDRRIALMTLSRIGVGYGRILIGTLVVTVVLSLLVPSATARVACVVPIMMGMIAAFGVSKDSPFAAGVMIMVAQATSVWNVGIQTAAAQNLLTADFIHQVTGQSISWSTWLLAGAPWAILMSVALYWVVHRLMPAKSVAIAGGKDTVKKALQELGPMSRNEKTLLGVTLVLLLLWATGGKLHHVDTATVTATGLGVLLLPGLGVMSWKEVQSRIPWGTLLVFGVGISLGSALLQTHAGQWLGNVVVQGMGLESLSPFWLFAVLSLFLIVVHLGFASATALTSTMMPILLSLLTAISSELNVPGMALLLGFAISFGFILPINAPQNMVCIGTDTFTSRQFIKVGIPVTIIGYLVMLLLAASWWPLLGLM
ncbi:DASS family sodium-coupled anion symporter [Gallaecimonas pentaromativorans]|uniref:DASS family sodium-coupled anion symporter n=1 Tax=Gallaecimonas pentaromativorans TaxID=584787 RepID=UPI003A8CCC9D